MRQIRVRPFIIVLIVLLVLLQYKLWFEPGGIVEMLHLKHEVVVQHDKNQLLRARNEVLAAQIRDLKNGNQIVEGQARHDLDMVKRGETFYRVVNNRGEQH